MKLYVANCTQQVQDFVYRTVEMPSARTQRIEIGGQVRLSGDFSTPQVDSIIDQHRKYGLVRVDEIDRTKPFIGVCVSIDKPVDVEKIKVALQHNVAVLEERGREIREHAAVAVNNAWEEQMGGGQLSKLEMSFVEEDAAGKQAEIAAGVRVTRAETPGGGQPPSSARPAVQPRGRTKRAA